MRLRLLASLAAAILALGPHGLRAEDTTPRDYGIQRYTPKDFHLPEGAGCSGDVARWQAVQANDYASGNVSLKVYGQIQGEIAQAAAACSAGHDREASRMIAASKSRHGYPP